MGYGRNGSPGCCCLEGCTIYGDRFASNTIGSNWTEVAGDWAIAGGILSIDETDGLLIANQEHPDGDGLAQVVTVDVRLAAADDRARVIIAWDDASNYLFAEVWIGADGCGHIQAYERIAGTDTAIGDEYAIPFAMPLEQWHTITLCYVPGESEQPGQLTLKAESGDAVWTNTVDTSAGLPGNQAGVGTGDPVTDDIDFDNFDFQFYFDEEEHPDCPQCEGQESCDLHSDNFNRAELGCAWEEVAGDWSIDSNQLTVDEEDAILRNRTQHPTDSAFVQVQFAFRAEAGVVILVILDWTDDENFFFVKLEPGSHGDCGRVSFWRRTADVDAEVGISSILLGMTADVDETHSVTICWRDEFIRVFLTPHAGSDYPPSSHTVNGIEQESEEPYVGLGTGTGGGSNQVWFDDFNLSRVRQATIDNTFECDECTLQECVLYFNDPRFDAPLTTFSCVWVVEAGTWTNNLLTSSNAENLFGFVTISGSALNELIEVSTDGAMLINETGHPMTTAEGYLDLTSAAEVRIVTFEYGDIVRLLIGVQDDENYLYAEIEFAADDESTGFLRVGKVVAGVETELDESATSVIGGQPGEDNDGSSSGQRPSILRVCYDGLELRAQFTNLASSTSGEFVAASGTAGTGWNPGKSGLATVTIASWVAFGGFRFYHDIFGGDPNCVPCSSGARCAFCRDLIETDLTPPILLAQFRDLNPNQPPPAPGCADAAQFNDTYALPFYEDVGGHTCRWKIFPHFCDASSGIQPAEIFVTLQALSGFTLASGVFKVEAFIKAYNPAAGLPTFGQANAVWDSFPHYAAASLPDYVDGYGFDCAEFFADWIDLDIQAFHTANWMLPTGVGEAATARVKVLA